jgi:putative pre-16S rRNA nuclease
MRPGVRLGVDVGSVRVGVARSDPAGLIATPVVTLRRARSHGRHRGHGGHGGRGDQRDQGDYQHLVDLVAEHGAIEVVVGLPRTLAGKQGQAASAAIAYAESLAARLPNTPIRLVDERLSTVGAQRDLHASGVDTRRGRKVIDQAAAVIILQSALDAERATGVAPGHLLSQRAGGDVGAGGAGTDMKVEE